LIDLKLEPYATRLLWELDGGGGEPEWGRLLIEFVERLSSRCHEAGNCVIGHIKGFAELPDGGYARVNVVSARVPADLAFHYSGSLAELTLTLNVLVYGLSAELLKKLTGVTAAETASRFGARVRVVKESI
jgi:hypothetical protein